MATRRVLLIAPLEGYDGVTGDTSYTESLLTEPPPGIQYTTYKQAVEDGTMVFHGRKPWHGALSRKDLAVFGLRSFELAMRRIGVLYREPIAYISTKPGAFDLVHQHLAVVRQFDPRLPVVSGAGYPLSQLYQARDHWSPRRCAVATQLEAWLNAAVDAHNPWLRPTRGAVMTVYTEHFRRWLVGRGVAADQIMLSTTALPVLTLPSRASDGRTLAFVGGDFDVKGGPVAIRAFQSLRAADSRWRMIVVTRSRYADKIPVADGVEVLLDLGRRSVLEEVLPRVDILLAPTRSDCGVPYVVLEAMQAGVCVVTSDLPWLDDRLTSPGARRVPAVPEAIAAAVDDIWRTGMVAAQTAAHERWSNMYSMPSLHRSLLAAYDRVSASGASSSTAG